MGGGIFARNREDPAPTVGIAGRSLGGIAIDLQRERRKWGSRRGTPRRYVLRETGESVLNHRIPNGKPRRKTRIGSIVYRGSASS